jgi:hypothetical protein
MSNGCGCNGKKESSGTNSPNLDPTIVFSTFDGANFMSDQKPTLMPPLQDSSSGSTDAGATAPSFTPATLAAATGAIAAWNNDKRVSALWSINQNRNSWVYVSGVGWKKLANNSDSAVVALTILAAHAKQTQTTFTYRDEADGMIHETYLW